MRGFWSAVAEQFSGPVLVIAAGSLRYWQTAMRLLDGFQQSGLELSTVSHDTVLDACANLGQQKKQRPL